MTKYLSKDIIDSRLKGQRLLLTSKGLYRPTIYDNQEERFDQLYDTINIQSVTETDKKKTTIVKIRKI